MFNSPDFVLFLGTSVLLILVPGPDIIFTITQGMSSGRKAGVLTAMGLALGNVVHTTAAAFGISVIFKTSQTAFFILKIMGALYLFYLAYKAFKGRNAQPEPLEKAAAQKGALSLVAKGFLMNVLNPKVAIFFLAFLPQFVNEGRGSVPLQIIVFGFIFIVLVMIIFGMLGYFAGTMGQKLARSGGFTRVMSYLSSFVFVGLGIKLVMLQNR